MLKIKDLEEGKWIRTKKHKIGQIKQIVNLSPFTIYVIFKTAKEVECIRFQALDENDPLETTIKNNKIRRVCNTLQETIDKGEEILIDGLVEKAGN